MVAFEVTKPVGRPPAARAVVPQQPHGSQPPWRVSGERDTEEDIARAQHLVDTRLHPSRR